MNTPRATMRLQFHKDFTFDDATSRVSYFSALGISHLYASPIMTARKGSLHGYDVIDPTRVNPELGGEQALERLVAALRARGMGLIVDIVPNHMAAVTDNPWWADVLARGRQSRYAHFFDIDWEPDDPALRAKVLLPILGKAYGEALAAGEIKLEQDPHRRGLRIRYFEHSLPIAAPNCQQLERAPLDAFDPATPRGREQLHALLERQHYRLAWWGAANDEINWRRFFDINDLAALRMENDEAFEAVHAKLFRLYAEGLLDGLRVDHVDGLSHPQEYCRKLGARLRELEHKRPRSAPAGRAYLVVEKILAANEYLPGAWEADGTTGYDFMDQVSALLHDGAGEEPLSELWCRLDEKTGSFAAVEEQSRRQILERSFSAQLESTVRAFHAIARSDLSTRDWSKPAIRRALREILVHFPVYRIYAAVGSPSQCDRAFLARALAGAKRICLPSQRPLIDRLGQWLAGQSIEPQAVGNAQIALTRFQQLSAPLCAKAVEDTAFYRYGRLLSRNDVGFDPGRFADAPSDFHRNSLARRSQYPRAMLATATHDHKRGEDVRARLAVLSEIADEWTRTLDRLLALGSSLQATVDGAPAPTPGDLAILFQAVVGAWPPALKLDDAAGLASFAERIAQWQQKALREAKQASDWAAPNEPYEAAARNFVARLFARPSDLLSDLAAFARRIGPSGALNGLAQTLLKLTAPGVPDFYQGTEYWDLSLVDPDNRRSVDFDARSTTLDSPTPAQLAAQWPDGRIKQSLIARVLAVRRVSPRLFSEGEYLPIETQGPLADHVVAFARVLGDASAITLVCRLPIRLLDNPRELAVAASAWQGTRLLPPMALRGQAFFDIVRSGSASSKQHEWHVGQMLEGLPIAFLVNDRARHPHSS
jgi:(1->4)-alpha-D-glucan 1-alpha-D-glucosylmutase